ncbi:MAG: alginate lyase family protein [Bacteroidales bacterium]|nr:alginate lyase family protein [Bacteroidales bacterium]
MKKTFQVSLISASPKILPETQNKSLYQTRIKIFNKYLDYSEKINWFLDLDSGISAPVIFARDINILDKKTGSAKHIWEVNRLLFLPQICLNYIHKKDKKYLNQFIEITRHWIWQNPYLKGVNWYSNIEVNIRLVNWFFCWEILNVNELMQNEPELEQFVKNFWLPSIYMHCNYSFANPSKYSSANNHLISEYAGLFIATSLWRFKESEKWNRYAKKGLEAEILKQHSENGVNKEEAAEYIQFITDFFLISYIVGENTGNSFSAAYTEMLKKIFYYILHFTDVDGNFPKYGDEDDGHVVKFHHDDNFNNFRSLLASGAIMFDDSLLKTKSNGFDMKNQILFGEVGLKKFNLIENINVDLQSSFYEKEGHFFLRKQQGSKETYIHFNAAPLGFLSIAAHGHADALSFSLRVNGKDILVDPGTYCYHTHPELRQYFIGTLAHNTIRINGKEQALNGGPTLWLKHYKTRISEFASDENKDRIVASHDGYKKSGFNHQREISFDKNNNELIISDFIENKHKKNCLVEFPLHLHPCMVPVERDDFISITDKTENPLINIIFDKQMNVKTFKGNNSPIMGWYSGSFYELLPCSTIYQHAETTDSMTITTIIKILQDK